MSFPEPTPIKPERPWYQKKRFVIPLGVLVILFVAGIFGSGGSDPGSSTAAPTTSAAAEDTRSPEEISASETLAALEGQLKQKQDELAELEREDPAEEAPAEDDETSGESNAVRSAENYLEYQAFSKKGLIKQLRFEKFSSHDANYAVNHITVDWNEQAVKSAKTYLESQSFSRASLTTQLKFEGFTTSQAKHGVKKAYK